MIRFFSISLSQTTERNSPSSSPHYDSAGKTAVLYPDFCVALLSTHSSFCGECKVSQINVMDSSRIPLYHTNDPRDLCLLYIALLYVPVSWSTSDLWLGFSGLSRLPDWRHSYAQNAGGIKRWLDTSLGRQRFLMWAGYQQTVTHNHRATVCEAGSWDGKPHRIMRFISPSPASSL